MDLTPVRHAIALLTLTLVGTPEERQLDVLVAELDRLHDLEWMYNDLCR